MTTIVIVLLALCVIAAAIALRSRGAAKTSRPRETRETDSMTIDDIQQQAAGNLDRQADLLFDYLQGSHSNDEKAQALSRLHDVAMTGNAQGQFRLGLSYDLGRGIARDTDQLKYWLGKASAQGHEQARLALDILNGETV